jgi:hypothetical protein
MKFFRRGTSKVRLAAAAPADMLEPTTTEVNAAVDLSPDIASMDGWTIENQAIPTPNLASAFTTSIPGEDTTGNPTLNIYEDDDDMATWEALARGTEAWLYLLPHGVAATKPVETWPVRVGARNRQWDAAGNVAAQFIVGFAVPEVPEVDGVVTAP